MRDHSGRSYPSRAGLINLAVKNEWMIRNPFARFPPRFIRNDLEFLSQEDLAAIETKEFKILRLQWAKDLFVFSCYTGLSYCDLMTLTKENISIGIDGEYWIMTSRRKTNQPVRVPLLPKALELIEKYKVTGRRLQPVHPKFYGVATLGKFTI